MEHRRAATAEAFVFASRNGTPLDSHNLLGRVLKPACKRAGLPLISWHSFRHYADFLTMPGRTPIDPSMHVRV